MKRYRRNSHCPGWRQRVTTDPMALWEAEIAHGVTVVSPEELTGPSCSYTVHVGMNETVLKIGFVYGFSLRMETARAIKSPIGDAQVAVTMYELDIETALCIVRRMKLIESVHVTILVAPSQKPGKVLVSAYTVLTDYQGMMLRADRPRNERVWMKF